jgi:prepilin-type N-terminal cleavage/methylation domain-containing protein
MKALSSGMLFQMLAGHKKRAFTATEMLVVLLILSILATISLSIFATQRKGSVISSEAQKLRMLMTTARSYALARNGYFRVAINMDRPSCWLDEVDSAGLVIKPKVVTSEPINEEIRIPEIKVDSSSHKGGLVVLQFNPNGTSNEASIYLIRAEADRTKPANFTTLKLYAPTARVDTFPGEHR